MIHVKSRDTRWFNELGLSGTPVASTGTFPVASFVGRNEVSVVRSWTTRSSVCPADVDVLEVCSQLTAHFAGVAGNLSNDVAFDAHVVAGAVERDPHPLARTVGGDDPGKSDLARVARRHDLVGATLADAPLGRARGVDDAQELAAT
jgi:hypothetical protein